MVKRHIDRQAAHAVLDRLLDLYQGRQPGLLGGEPTEPASGSERGEALRNAEQELLGLLAPALPSQEPPKLGIHSHAGRYRAVQLRGEVVLWWAKVEGIGTNKAVDRAKKAAGVGRSTVFDWLETVDEEHRHRVELQAEALSKGSPPEWVELANAYSRLFTERYLWMIHEVFRRRSGK